MINRSHKTTKINLGLNMVSNIINIKRVVV